MRVDNVFECFEGPLPLVSDCAVTDARQLNAECYKNGTEREYQPGTAAINMEQHKRDKYHELLPEDPSTKICVFKAPVFEAHGRWSDDARFMFKHLIDRAHEKTGEPKSVLSSYWRSRLVFAHHKAAAAGFQAKLALRAMNDQSVSPALKNKDWADEQICKT